MGGGLKGLGYYYDASGTLRSLSDNSQFKFMGQAHYTNVADAVAEHIQVELKKVMQVKKIKYGVPLYVHNLASQKILVIIQGSGRVQPGIWGCSICINDEGGLKKGSMLSYIAKAKENNYGIVILNPNYNPPYHPLLALIGRNPDKIPRGAQHVIEAWKEVVLPLAVKGAEVDVVAHSAGGGCFLNLLMEGDNVVDSVRRVAFTDSYHSYAQTKALSPKATALLYKCINYVCTEEVAFGQNVQTWRSLNNTKEAPKLVCACVSANCSDHAMTNFAALDDIFVFLRETPPRKLQLPGSFGPETATSVRSKTLRREKKVPGKTDDSKQNSSGGSGDLRKSDSPVTKPKQLYGEVAVKSLSAKKQAQEKPPKSELQSRVGSTVRRSNVLPPQPK